MKRLKVPFIATIHDMNLSEVVPLIVEEGVSDMVEKVNWPVAFPYKPLTQFNLLRSTNSFFIRFYVRGNLLKAVYSEDQSPVYKDSCVEFFCQVPGNDYYTNFEFNCIGTCSASRRKSRNDDVQLFNSTQMNTIKRLPSIGRRAFNEMQGMFEWELSVEIPLQLMGIDPNNVPEKIMANFYKCADDTDSPHFVSWSPIGTENPDFHRPEYFGELAL
jgi:hypothetical protein